MLGGPERPHGFGKCSTLQRPSFWRGRWIQAGDHGPCQIVPDTHAEVSGSHPAPSSEPCFPSVDASALWCIYITLQPPWTPSLLSAMWSWKPSPHLTCPSLGLDLILTSRNSQELQMWSLKKVNVWDIVKRERGGGSFPKLEGISPAGVSDTTSDGQGFDT